MTNTHFVLKINLIMTILQVLDSYYRNKLYDPSESRNKSFQIKYIITFRNVIKIPYSSSITV